MDRRAPPPPSRRDVVFCHECEHEWYQDEHGLICPDCRSDFTEIVGDGSDTSTGTHFINGTRSSYLQRGVDRHPSQIESNNDLRTDFTPEEILPPASFRNSTPFDPGNVPDPDIDDIHRFNWGLPPRSPGMQQPEPHRDPHRDPHRAEVHRNFQNTFSGLLGANAPQGRVHGQWTMRTVNLGNGGSVTFSSGTLFPRDANGPQPGMMPVENLHNVLASLLMGLEGPGGTRGPFGEPMGMPRGGVANPLGAFFNAMFNPAAAQHGDWVYSQEALDRVISQLMEQNATGNAPGPASADAMANLPKVKVTKEMMGDNGKAECSICMDDVALDDEVSQLPCKHWFHEQCVKAWLGEHDTCPHCRKGIGEQTQQQGNGRSSTSRNTSGMME